MRGATECSHCVRSQKLVELACSSPSSSKWHQDHGINLSPLTNTSIPSMEYLKVVEYNVRQKNESARLNAFQADKIIPGVKGRFIDGGLPNNGVYNATSPTTPN